MPVDGGGRHDRPSDRRILHLDRARRQSNRCPWADNLDVDIKRRMWLRARGRRGCRAQRPRRGRGRSNALLLAGSRYQRQLRGRGPGRGQGLHAALRAGPRRPAPAVRPGAERSGRGLRSGPGRSGSSARSIAAHCVGVPATAIAFSRFSSLRTGTCALSPSRTSSASAWSSRGAGGSRWRCRSLWRTTPICVETWKPEPSTSSVEPPPMSITRYSPAARPKVAPA